MPHDDDARSNPTEAGVASAILGYFEDGPNLVIMAMNGWGEDNLASWSARRPKETAVVILEPRKGR